MAPHRPIGQLKGKLLNGEEEGSILAACLKDLMAGEEAPSQEQGIHIANRHHAEPWEGRGVPNKTVVILGHGKATCRVASPARPLKAHHQGGRAWLDPPT